MISSFFKIFNTLLKIVCAGVLALIILSLFVIFYDYTGVHVANLSGATDYTWESCQILTTMQEGFAWIRMDENGYNNAYYSAPKKDIDILLMGSSHMEALNVAGDQNTGYMLNMLLPEMYTYNIGVSGHTIYRCVDDLQAAVDVYDPKEYVTIFTSKIMLNPKAMQEIINGTAKPIPSYDTGVLYGVQKYLPAVKKLFKSVQSWSRLTVQEDTEDASEDIDFVMNISEYEEILNQF